jgi:hypothetical protein
MEQITSNTYYKEYVDTRDAIVRAYSIEKPEPFRLVMVKCKDFCQFCVHPKGDVYHHEISDEHKFGFLSCNLCLSKGKSAVVDWFETKAYGNANCLRNKEIKVQRSSGTVESDWELNKSNPFVENINGFNCVNVIKTDKTIKKWATIDELIELNK